MIVSICSLVIVFCLIAIFSIDYLYFVLYDDDIFDVVMEFLCK